MTVEHNADEAAAAWRQLEFEIEAALPGLAVEIGDTIATAVKGRASGRPGPNAPTGDYRASIEAAEPEVSRGQMSIEVGTDKPQGYRLEHGFDGTDSAGRAVTQPPYPHWDPGMNDAEPIIDSLIETTIDKALR